MCAAADDGEAFDPHDNDDDNEADDPYIAYRSLVTGLGGRWAPASKGSRWVQRDSKAALAVSEMIKTQAAIELDSQTMPLVRVRTRLGEGRFGDVLLGELADGRSVH